MRLFQREALNLKETMYKKLTGKIKYVIRLLKETIAQLLYLLMLSIKRH